MRKFKMGLVTLAATAAVCAPAGLVATAQADDDGEVNVTLLSGNEVIVSPAVAATLCGIDVRVINASEEDKYIKCTTGAKAVSLIV